MTQDSTTTRAFRAGTPGWTAADLEDPRIAQIYDTGRHEIINGVLTDMGAAYFAHSRVLGRLTRRVIDHFDRIGLNCDFAPEADVVLDEDRILRPDMAFLTLADQQRQSEAVEARGRSDASRCRLYVPPTLVIESVSPGYERHDRVTKRRWYAQFGVPHYWIVDAGDRSLQCLRLEGQQYQTDAAGHGDETIRLTSFRGMSIELAPLWSA